MAEGRIVRRARAREDLLECADYLAQEVDYELAQRFLDNVEASLAKLAANPDMGWPCRTSEPRLEGVRTWRIQGFENHLVFYLPIDGGVLVLRILHGHRDGLHDLIAEQRT